MVVSDTPQDTTHEMTSTLGPHSSGKNIRSPVSVKIYTSGRNF